MSCINNQSNINETFIIEPTFVGTDVISACTGVFTNNLLSCSGNTSIILANNDIIFSGSLFTSYISGTSIDAGTYYSGGTNLSNIINNGNIINGNFNNITDTLILNKQNGNQILVTGFTDYYTTGATLIDNTIFFNRNDQLSAYTINLGSLTTDTYVTGVTFTNNQIFIKRNDGVILSTFVDSFTGLSVDGLILAKNISGLTISATTFYGDGSKLSGISIKDTYITGGTYNDGTITLTNNTGGTFNINGFMSSVGLTMPSGFTVTNSPLISTGGTLNVSTNLNGIILGDGSGFKIVDIGNGLTLIGDTLSAVPDDSVTQVVAATTSALPNSPVYDNGVLGVGATLTATTNGALASIDTQILSIGSRVLIKNQTSQLQNGVYDVTDLGSPSSPYILTRSTDADETSELDSQIVAIGLGSSNKGKLFTQTTDNPVVGTDTIVYTLATNRYVTQRATGSQTEYNIPYWSTGSRQLSKGTANFKYVATASTLYTPKLLISSFAGGGTKLLQTNNTGLISTVAFPVDVFVTGGTYSNGTITVRNNTGGTFSITGLFTGQTDNDRYTTGGTFNQTTRVLSLVDNSGNTISVTGITDSFLTGGTYLNGSLTLTNNTGGTFSVSGFSTGGTSSTTFTGGTVSGATNFINGLTATTISATTYLNLPIDIRVTGGTYSNGSAVFTNNTGGTFTVTGFSTGGTSSTTFTGGTVSGATNFTGGLSANTFSATTYLNLPIDIRVTGATKSGSVATFTNNTGGTFTLTGLSDVFVTGGTYSNGTAIFTNNTGGTFSVSGFSTGGTSTSTFTGGTVTGSTIFTNGLSANTISATTYLNLPLDIRVTGGTYNAGTATFINNTGGTFSVTGFSSSGTISGDYLPLSGGTVSGNTIFNSGLTVNYIDFDITPTIPNPTGGTLFFDSNENALSYKPITNQNDVTVNLGQESLIRVYNALPTTILNGQVLHITGATSSVPTVALANASKLGATFTDSLAQSSGVATHDIPSGEYGFMTNFGVVRDLNTTAFTVGQEVFLSDTIDGALTNDPNNIAFTSRISTVGYCLESNATTGKILVVITNENLLQSLTQQEINVLLGNTISTGAYFYTGATTASTTTINVSPMRGWIVYNTGPTYATNPLVLNIYYSGGTNISITGLTSSFDTYLLVNSGGTLYQTNTYPTPQERRQNIFLGRVVHPNKTTILNIEQNVDYDVSPLSSLRDLWVPIKIINEGVVPSPNGANLTFKTSSGTFWGNGIGFPTNELNPNAITVPAYLPASFYYTTQTGGTFTATTTTVDTLNYDVGGVKTNVPGTGNYTTQRIYMSQSGVIRLQYGQNHYSTLAKAIAAIPSETFVVNSDNSIDCTLIGLLTVKDGTGDLSNADDAVFTFVSKFGEILGGTAGISTTTLQQAYNNSTNPEIATNTTLGGVQFKGGTGNDTDKNIIIENNSGVETGFITADGKSMFNTVSATTISATTYQNLPLDIRVTGGTYSNGTAIFTNNSGGTFNVTGFSTGYTLTSTAITNALGYTPLSSFTDNDRWTTGGTYTVSSSTITLRTNSGDTVNITGITASQWTTVNTNDIYYNTGNVAIGTTSAPNSKLEIQTNSLGAATGQTNTSGIALINTTAAANVAQQISPALRFRSNGWASTPSASQPVDFRIFSLPVQGNSAPTGTLIFQAATNGAYNNILTVGNTGNLSVLGSFTLPSGTLAANNNTATTNAAESFLSTTAGTQYSTLSRNTGSQGLNANTSWVSNIFGQVANTLPSIGTAILSATVGIKAINITNTGNVTTCAALIVEGVSTLATNNYSIYSTTGVNRFDGGIVIGAATIASGSSLDVQSVTRGSSPFPRMTQAQRTAISSPTVGLHVYQTDPPEGVYVFKSSGWTFAY